MTSSRHSSTRAWFAPLSGIVGMMMILVPAAAQAQFGLGGIVFDPRTFAENVLIYKRAYDQLMAARQQLQAQMTALQKLRHPQWRDIGALMSQADALARQGNALAYSLGSIDTDFQRLFPGTISGSGYQQRQAVLVSQTSRTLATLRSVLDATAHTAQSFPAGVLQLRTMKAQMAGITGHEAALEFANTVGTYSAEELMLLRQQLAAATNAQTVYYAQQVNDRAQREANERALWSWFTQPPAPSGLTRGLVSFQP